MQSILQVRTLNVVNLFKIAAAVARVVDHSKDIAALFVALSQSHRENDSL